MPEPYKNTRVSSETTKGKINEMLKKHGVKAIRWTDISERHEIHLEFGQTVNIEGVQKDIGVEIRVPIKIPVKDSWGGTAEVSEKDVRQATNQCYRAVYWWLKSQLEAIEFGVQRFEQVFFYNIVAKLPDGSTTTIGEASKEGILKMTDFSLEPPKTMYLPPEKTEEER